MPELIKISGLRLAWKFLPYPSNTQLIGMNYGGRRALPAYAEHWRRMMSSVAVNHPDRDDNKSPLSTTAVP